VLYLVSKIAHAYPIFLAQQQKIAHAYPSFLAQQQ